MDESSLTRIAAAVNEAMDALEDEQCYGFPETREQILEAIQREADM